MSTVCGALAGPEPRPIPTSSAHPTTVAVQWEVFSYGPSTLNKEGDSAGLQYLLEVLISLCSYTFWCKSPLDKINLNFGHYCSKLKSVTLQRAIFRPHCHEKWSAGCGTMGVCHILIWAGLCWQCCQSVAAPGDKP